MRIAQVSPLFESVPPRLYGGTERVVSWLTEELVDLGHEVTLFASGDSVTSACLVPTGRCGLRAAGARENLAPHLLMFERLRALADEFDVIHFHTEYMHFPLARELEREFGVTCLSTLHGRLDLPEYRDLFNEYRDLALVSISRSQRRALPDQNWIGTVHHGMREGLMKVSPAANHDYLLFVGRISPEKGVLEAIEIAERAKMLLKIAAKIETYDLDYYRSIESLLRRSGVKYVGEVGEAEKAKLLGGAKALLFPIAWPEPFGLVMIEALACGAPVIAFANGSVPEVIRDGKTGFIVNNVIEACEAIEKLPSISRRDCRRDFELRFSVERMATDYLEIYETQLLKKQFRTRAISHARPLSRILSTSTEVI